METRIKLGVVGFGRRGRVLFKLAAKSFAVEAVAVCDSDGANLKAAKQDYPDVACFSKFDRMLDDVKLDALLVETPATFHAELSSRALARNIHVMSGRAYGLPRWRRLKNSGARNRRAAPAGARR